MKHLKKALCLLLCAALCAALSVCVFAQDASTWGDVRQDNFIRITSVRYRKLVIPSLSRAAQPCCL